jgi:hypothetical protein
MPPLHTIKENIEKAEEAGLKLVTKMETSRGDCQWYNGLEGSLCDFLETKLCHNIVYILECCYLLPAGFTEFLKLFVVGNLVNIVRSGQKGIISGGEILVYQKPLKN